MVLNLLPSQILIKINDETMRLNSEASIVKMPRKDDIFSFTFAFEVENGTPKKSSTSRYRIRDDNQRLLLIVAAEEDGEFNSSKPTIMAPKLFHLYDNVPSTPQR